MKCNNCKDTGEVVLEQNLFYTVMKPCSECCQHTSFPICHRCGKYFKEVQIKPPTQAEIIQAMKIKPINKSPEALS